MAFYQNFFFLIFLYVILVLFPPFGWCSSSSLRNSLLNQWEDFCDSAFTFRLVIYFNDVRTDGRTNIYREINLSGDFEPLVTYTYDLRLQILSVSPLTISYTCFKYWLERRIVVKCNIYTLSMSIKDNISTATIFGEFHLREYILNR